jgi:uncharacterized protein YceK
MKKLFLMLLLPVLLAGCTTITNLTPSQYSRDPSGYYRVEAAWKSKRQAINPASFQPVVVIGFNTYPMRPVPVVQDRWEAFIPVPADKDSVLYRYKFDYQVYAISRQHPDSMMSPEYTLKISEKK